MTAGYEGRRLPDIDLAATDGSHINLLRSTGLTVVYAYPRTSPPDGQPIPGWSEIPGAKGCTPQSCGFRDQFTALKKAGVDRVFGLSTQTTAYQREVVDRLHLPFALLSDADLAFQQGLGLPVFEAGGMTLLHRLTMVVGDGVIKKVFHPIPDPAANAAEVLQFVTGA